MSVERARTLWQIALLLLVLAGVLSVFYVWRLISTAQGGNPVTLSGVVINADTHRGLENAIVYVRSTGWDPLSGRGIMGANEAMDTTDSQGQFSLQLRRLTRTRGVAVHQGYAPMALSRFRHETLTIPLVPLPPDADSVAASPVALRLGGGKRRDYLSLQRLARTDGPDSADVVIEVVEDIQPFIVVAGLGSGAIFVHAPPRDQDTSLDPMTLACRAPTAGYVASDTLIVTGDPLQIYARSRDDRLYGRIRIDPGSIVQAAMSARSSGVGIIMWVNLSGGSSLCGPDPLAYDYMVGKGFPLQSYLHGIPESLHPHRRSR